MRRRIAHFIFVTALGTVGLVLGGATALVETPAGRGLLARYASEFLDRVLHGNVQVAAISGSFLSDLTLEGLVVHDTTGQLLASIPRAQLSYRLPNLLAGRYVLSRLSLDQPTIQLVKPRHGRMNYEAVLGLGQGTGGGRPPLVEFRQVEIRNGSVTILVPWTPPDSARTPAQVVRAIAAEQAKPGREIVVGPDGWRRAIRIQGFTTRMARARVSSPGRGPVTIDLDSLAARVSDPGVTVRDATGHITIAGDSILFTLSRGALPGTTFRGTGKISWPRDTLLYDFDLNLPTLDLADLRWVSPDFPAMTGSARVTGRAEPGARQAYAIRDLTVSAGRERIEGRVVAVTDRRRGLGVRGMDLALVELDLDKVRPYLDTLPLEGNLTGSLRGNGFLDDLEVDLDWAFEDARLADHPVSRLSAVGRVHLGGPLGMEFDSLVVRSSDIELRTVRLVTPSMTLVGRAAGVGTLRGPWRNVRFDGTIRHRDGDAPQSVVTGMVRLDTRADTTAFATDVLLDPLELDGLKPSYPGIGGRGSLRGRLRLNGTLGHLTVDVDVTGEAGTLKARGTVVLLPPRFEAEALQLGFSRLDLSRLAARMPATDLTGSMLVSGAIDSATVPQGDVRVALGPGRIGEFPFDSIMGAAVLHDRGMRLDSLRAYWPGGMAEGSGRTPLIGAGDSGIVVRFAVQALRPLDSLLYTLSGIARDTTPGAGPLSGSAEGTLVVDGTLDTLELALQATGHDLQWQSLRTPLATALVRWRGGTRPRFGLSVASDSLAYGNVFLSDLAAGADGPLDSLAWQGRTAVGSSLRLAGGGVYRRPVTAPGLLLIDSLTAALPSQRWRLLQPVEVTLRDSSAGITRLALDAEDGSGEIRVEGQTPGLGNGDLTVDVRGLDLRDVYSVLQRDTTRVSGSIAVNLNVGGTRRAPTFRGTAALSDASFGDSKAPFVQSVVDYADRRLELNLLFWRTGRRVLQLEARLPVDLALLPVPDRRVPGPLDIHAVADSVDLAVLEAYTRVVRRVSGVLNADLHFGGTWSKPDLTGFAEIRNGAAAVPDVGVSYQRVNGRFHLEGDSLVIDRLSLAGGEDGEGSLQVTGGLQLQELTRPRLTLDFVASDFPIMDVRSFLTLTASGHFGIRGPLLAATLRGTGTAKSGVLYFADLITKQIIDLEDPLNAGLIDSSVVRTGLVGAAFQNRFLDSLRIQNFRMTLGENFWLRSSEANIQLDGAVTVNKEAKAYRLDGTLNALRGTYVLKIGFVTRSFTVERGTVRYFGTPDLNAELDIQARHTVRAVDRDEDIPVIAKITGTLLSPKLTLESTFRPPLSETELVSYLMFGKPSFGLATATDRGIVDQRAAFQTGLAYLSSALSSEIERTLISDVGVPIDFIEIRPAGPGGTGGNAAGQTTVAAGWQIGAKTFLTFNAGFCPGLRQLSYRSLGSSFEYRFTREWRVQTSLEPLQSCLGPGATETISASNRYQLGFDLLWDREY